VVKYSNIYNYDLGEGNVNFHDNYGDSVGYVVYHGSPYYGEQKIPSVIVHAGNPQKTKMTLKDNTMLHTGGGGNIAYAVYGGNNFKVTNDTCNNRGGQMSVLSTPFVAQSCDDGGGGETRDSVYSIVHDTAVLKAFPPQTGRVYDSTVIDTISVTAVKVNGKPATKVISRNKNWAVYDTIQQQRDSVVIEQTPPHDTTIKVKRRNE